MSIACIRENNIFCYPLVKFEVYYLNKDMSDLLTYSFVTIASVFVFLFAFWRNLKEDYIPSQIFSTAFYVLAFSFTGYGMSYFASIYTFWIVIVFFTIGLIHGFRRKGIKPNEAVDAMAVSIWLALLFTLPIILIHASIDKVIFYIMVTVSGVAYFAVKKYYKTFVWYRSGRRGFPAYFSIGLFFLLRSFVSIINPGLTLFQTEYDIFISGLISAVSFFNIFVLGKL